MAGPKTTPDGRRISYAQNGEDIVLLRAFAGQRSGMWIDVGANHPVNDSVTKNFSDLGWTGINIEPVSSFFDLLRAERTHDVNVNAALSDGAGSLTFHQNESNLDLSTFDDELVAIYRQRGDRIVDVEVPVLRLQDVCREHAQGRVIDFLKVDTEGHELAVLRGHDFDEFPVRAICAEATDARLPALVDHLTGVGFHHVAFDGLNAWFVCDAERDTLGVPLSRPASPVLDWYHPAVYVEMMRQRDDRIAELIRRVEALEAVSPAVAPIAGVASTVMHPAPTLAPRGDTSGVRPAGSAGS